MDNVSKSGTAVSQSATKINSSFDQTKTSSEGAVTSYQKYNSEGQKITSTNTNVSGSIEKVGTSTKGASTSFDAMASSTGKLASESDKSKGSVDALGTAHTTLKGNVDAAKGGLDAHNTTLTTVDQSSTKTAASTTQLGSSFMAQVGSATALIGSATTLWQSYDSLGDAQLRVDKATNTLHATQIKIQTLQTQLNKLTLEGKEGTDEYAIVQDKLQLAQDKLAANEGTLNNAQEDLNVTYSNFARDIIPQVVTVFGSFTSLLANSKGGLSGFAQGIKGIGTEGSAVSKILSMISLTNPFFIAITVGAALVGAFVTNLFGFRDAVNSLGVALGKAVPFLKPLLDLMGGFGQSVVDLMEWVTRQQNPLRTTRIPHLTRQWNTWRNRNKYQKFVAWGQNNASDIEER